MNPPPITVSFELSPRGLSILYRLAQMSGWTMDATLEFLIEEELARLRRAEQASRSRKEEERRFN